ncbi:hypothetical protein DERP_008472 [Dermatophagoides pteronyssinus]|uniref:Uncharacterized protein n=1 Tax=Dermatophagoides pteronyssinus TaxID=6956 RepID=A0ABQ8IVD5_DERPT|nr:hypothetical protein DERP_008472 [Dermatophagoides pteronyssinus]
MKSPALSFTGDILSRIVFLTNCPIVSSDCCCSSRCCCSLDFFRTTLVIILPVESFIVNERVRIILRIPLSFKSSSPYPLSLSESVSFGSSIISNSSIDFSPFGFKRITLVIICIFESFNIEDDNVRADNIDSQPSGFNRTIRVIILLFTKSFIRNIVCRIAFRIKSSKSISVIFESIGISSTIDSLPLDFRHIIRVIILPPGYLFRWLNMYYTFADSVFLRFTILNIILSFDSRLRDWIVRKIFRTIVSISLSLVVDGFISNCSIKSSLSILPPINDDDDFRDKIFIIIRIFISDV